MASKVFQCVFAILNTSSIVLLIADAVKISLTITPTEWLHNFPKSNTLVMTCSFRLQKRLTPSDSVILYIQRRKQKEAQWFEFASINALEKLEFTESRFVADIFSKKPQLDGNIWKHRNDTNGFLNVTFAIDDIGCDDAKSMYRCFLEYKQGSNHAVIFSKAGKYKVIYMPSVTYNFSITAENVDHVDRDLAKESGLNNNTFTNTGRNVNITCRTNIGSKNTTIIQWYKSDPSQSDLIPYNPKSEHVTIENKKKNCSYVQQTTIKYTVTPEDGGSVCFQCCLSVSYDSVASLEAMISRRSKVFCLNINYDTTWTSTKHSPSFSTAYQNITEIETGSHAIFTHSWPFTSTDQQEKKDNNDFSKDKTGSDALAIIVGSVLGSLLLATLAVLMVLILNRLRVKPSPTVPVNSRTSEADTHNSGFNENMPFHEDRYYCQISDQYTSSSVPPVNNLTVKVNRTEANTTTQNQKVHTPTPLRGDDDTEYAEAYYSAIPEESKQSFENYYLTPIHSNEVYENL